MKKKVKKKILTEKQRANLKIKAYKASIVGLENQIINRDQLIADRDRTIQVEKDNTKFYKEQQSSNDKYLRDQLKEMTAQKDNWYAESNRAKAKIMRLEKAVSCIKDGAIRTLQAFEILS